jgi:hypothetical protein
LIVVFTRLGFGDAEGVIEAVGVAEGVGLGVTESTNFKLRVGDERWMPVTFTTY